MSFQDGKRLIRHENRRLTQTTFYTESSHPGVLIIAMLLWIFVSKMVKIAPHFCDHPWDLLWLPAYLGYAYWHSLVKLYCAVTFWDHSWGGRDLSKLKKGSVNNVDQSDSTKTIATGPDVPQGVTNLVSEEPNGLSESQKS